jgi:hypothetical protein
LSLATLKGGFLPLEPIPILVTIANPTEHPVRGHTGIDFSADHIKLYVSKGQEESRRITSLSLTLSNTLVRSRDIEPGEEVTRPQLLKMNLGEVFPEPGVYHVEAVLFDVPYEHSIRSNKLQIKILQPKGEDAKALDFIMTKENKYSFFSGDRFADRNFVQVLEQFAFEFKDTPYADYADYLLSEHYSLVGDSQSALTHLAKLEKKADFVYRDEVAVSIGQLKRRLK